MRSKIEYLSPNNQARRIHTMKTNRLCVLLVRTLVVVCLTFSLAAPSGAQSESARRSEKDNSPVDIVVQGALD
jgi:hypothetical protein